ncbi:MAG: hypothetical protein ACK40O_11960 [Allosphingosinicella sp.]
MTRTAPFIALAAAGLALASCGGESPNENAAEALEEAAEQSTPAAADVLENAADGLREGDPDAPASVDAAMQAAGNAQAEAVRPPTAQKAPPQQQARPHGKGDPVPPTKVDADAAAGGEDHSGHEGQ